MNYIKKQELSPSLSKYLCKEIKGDIMENRIAKVKNHKLIHEIEKSLKLVDDMVDLELDNGHLVILQRISHVLSHLKIIYRNTDPLMINPKRLTHFFNSNIGHNSNHKVSNLSRHLEEYKIKKNIQYLNNANTITDGLITIFSYFIYPKTGREVAGLRKANEKYHSVINEYISNVQEQLKTFKQSYEEMSASIESGIDDKNSEMENFKKTIQGEQNTLNEKMSHEIQTKKENYQEIMNKHISEVEGIVGALAERSISYGFQQIANDERKAKKKWNMISLYSLFSLVVYTIAMVVISFSHDTNLTTALMRLFGGIGSFGALASFCIRQASNHANAERFYRQRELELASLSPYLAGYDKEALFNIKKELAKRYFGNSEYLINKKVGIKKENNK